MGGEAGRFSIAERIRFAIISRLGYWAVTLIGASLRWESPGIEHLEAVHRAGQRAILTFWHGRIIPATWYFRRRGIVVMTSMNRDGEIIARCIQRFGYGAARGSSSRGGFRALAEMSRALGRGRDVAFTIDGPRGPRYVAKQGPVILARKTGAAIVCFHATMKRRIQLKSWDQFQIPLPFTRALLAVGPPLWIAPDADENEVRACHERMQQILDELRERGDHWAAEA